MIKKIFALPVIEQISPVLSRRKLDELDLIVVDHPQVKASFALQGAHLLSWKPAGEEEVLWLSNNTPFKNGIAIRGGGCRLFVFDRLGIVGGVLAVTPASVVLRYSDGNFYTMYFCVDACFRLWLLCGES